MTDEILDTPDDPAEDDLSPDGDEPGELPKNDDAGEGEPA